MDWEALKKDVAAKAGLGPATVYLINRLADELERTLKADGLGPESQTAQLASGMRAEAEGLAHLAQIGTRWPE